MAVGTRHSRPFVFGGHRFRWRCEFNHPLEVFSTAWAEDRITSPDRLLVRPEEGPHRLLTVTWPPCAGPAVTPSLVRACVEEAVRQGWLSDLAAVELAGADLPPNVEPRSVEPRGGGRR